MSKSTNSPLTLLQAARLRTREMVPDLSRTAFGEPRDAGEISVRFTLFRSATDTNSGQLWQGSLVELGNYLRAEGRKEIKDKRRAPTMTQAVSATGVRNDASCSEITMFFGDADDVGDWQPLCDFLDTIGAAYVVHRSSSHGLRETTGTDGRKQFEPDPENGFCKWHLFIPLTEPLRPPRDWRQWKTDVYEPQYGWICGVLSEIGRLQEKIDGHPRDRKYGLDHSTSDLISAAFVGRKLTRDAPDREVRYSANGGTLNWDRFLEVTGYHEARQAQAAEQAALAHPVIPPPPMQVDGQSYTPGEFAQRLRIALRAANLLGERIDAKRTYCLCPWRNEHSEGEQKSNRHDTSTVLFDADGGGIQFICLHAHCTERDARTVWAWLRSTYPDAIPRRIIPARQIPQSTELPADAPIVSELRTCIEGVWNSAVDEPSPEAAAFLQSSGMAAGAEGASGEIKHLAGNKGALTTASAARLKALSAKLKADAQSLTTEEQIEHLNLTVARCVSQYPQMVYAVRSVGGAICGLILRCMSDVPHPNHRNRFIGDVASGLLGNPNCSQRNEMVLSVEDPDAYLLYAAPGLAEGITVYWTAPDSYGPLTSLDLSGRKFYLSIREPSRAKQIARIIRRGDKPPSDIFNAPPPKDGTLAGIIKRGVGAQAHCSGGESIPPDPGSPASSEGDDNLPSIVLSTQIHKNVAEGIAAIAVLPEVYQRHGLLVQIIEDNDPSCGVWRPKRAPITSPISKDHLTELCARAARWYKVKIKKEGVDYEPAMPSGAVVGAIHTRNVLGGVRELKFITTTPTLRPDGTIIAHPGYDAATGIAYMPAMQFDPVPDNPTEAQIVKAVQDLLEVVCDFPFKTVAGKSAWLAALLTRLGRFTFDGPVPMFIVDANAPGSGKGLLVDTICLIADGKPVGVLRYSGDSDEDEKRIFSILREGSAVACFDNIDPGKELGHDVIDQLLTSTLFKGRVLGKTETPTYDNFTVWMATGNNVRVGGDTVRRTVRIVLRTDDEHPEERDNFRHPEPRTWILSNRTRLVSAGLTLFRGWYAAGKPRAPLKALGSFEAWTGVIRQVCVWVSDICARHGIQLTDPLAANDEEHIESDEKISALPALLKGWSMLCADKGVPGISASDAIEELRRDGESVGGAPPPNKYRALRETINELLPPRRRSDDLPSPQILSHIIRSFKFRVVTIMLDGALQPVRLVNGASGGRFWSVVKVQHAPVQAPPIVSQEPVDTLAPDDQDDEQF